VAGLPHAQSMRAIMLSIVHNRHPECDLQVPVVV
jgi:hypothetical protein